ncbi:MAG: beta-lactamase family protein [Oscillospiraceae bacterium]|nr:beta-lactamase family protein [Oscillospiraceae bacterium]
MKIHRHAAVIAAAALVLVPVCTASLPAHAADAEPPALTTIASISKMFSTTAVLQLAEEGKVDPDAPVTEYLPEFSMADSRYRDITVRMLMNHTSGLMGTTAADFMLLGDRDSTPHDKLLSRLKLQKLKADPGAFGAYCNDGFSLLEQITERVSGESFTDYVQNHICKPLGLKQTGTPWDDAFQSPLQAETYLGSARFSTDYCMALGSGGILSTAPELCTFGTAFFKGNETLLSDETKAEMNRSSAADRYEDGFGLGWDIVDYPDYSAAGVKVVSKGGDVIMQHGELLVAPDEKISVAVLSSGGSSSADSLLGQALLDIALAEKGITVEHPEQQKKETLAEVPAEYLAYEGIYTTGGSLVKVTFPQQQYMEIVTLGDEHAKPAQYLFTTEDSFVLTDGRIESGRAVQASDQTLLTFRRRNGKDYICADSSISAGILGRFNSASYYAERLTENSVSADVQSRWDALSGKKYYLYSEKYSSTSYAEQCVSKITTYPEAPGYVNALKMTDGTHAVPFVQMPGSRDLTGYALEQKDGRDFLTLTDNCVTLISEDSVPELTADMHSISLHTKQAAWYRISDAMKNQTVTLNIPEHAAVYVYDKFDSMTYSSYMPDYGNTVTLPKDGKIVFLGEDGGSIGIS